MENSYVTKSSFIKNPLNNNNGLAFCKLFTMLSMHDLWMIVWCLCLWKSNQIKSRIFHGSFLLICAQINGGHFLTKLTRLISNRHVALLLHQYLQRMRVILVEADVFTSNKVGRRARMALGQVVGKSNRIRNRFEEVWVYSMVIWPYNMPWQSLKSSR